jgi:DNA-binding SARP family transcriptional activator
MAAAALSGQDLSIQLLGRLEVRRGAEPSSLPASKKSRALLAYLVATARPHLRERLCELLWEVPDDPRASLRWSLAKLRPLVDDGPTVRLVGNRDELVFESRGARVDIVELRDELGAGPEAASIESLRRAAQLFRGEFLEGLDLTGCYRYHEWWIAEREKTRATRLAILEQLISRLHDVPEEALEYARQRLALDPLAESAHLGVIRLLGSMGRTREAIAQYDRCKRLLLAELGAEPSAELTAMRVGLSARVTAPRPTSVPPAATAPAALSPRETLPIVGRLRELERARAVIEEAASGREHPALQVIGEPGIGKTRLLEEFGHLVRARGGMLLSGRAFEAEAVRPYGPFIDALRSVALPQLPLDIAHDLRPLLPELPDGSPSERSPASGHSNRSFDAVTRVLPLIGRPGVPVLVVLDDIQWFDEASAALLHFAVRALSCTQVLFALGVRPAELHDNPTVMRVLKSLARERRIEQLALLPLDAAETQALVAAAVHGADASRVYADSEGNPFFCLEIARALEAGEAPLSRSLEDLIGDRFDRLGPTAAQLLTWAAALGRSFAPDLLAKVVPFPAADLVTGIEELLRRGILRSVPSAEAAFHYDFAHDLLRQAAYRKTSEARRQLVHAEIARLLSQLPDANGLLAADVAHHAALGGNDELCARACIAAGQRCIRVFANLEAQALADRGRQRLDRLASEVRIPLQMGLLRVSIESGGWRLCSREIESDLTQTILEAQSAGLLCEVTAGWELLSELHEEIGDTASAQQSLALSEQASRDADPETRARAIARAGRCLAQLEQDMPRAKALLEEAVGLSANLKLDLPDISVGLGLIRYQEGEHEASLRLLEGGFAGAARQKSHWLASESLSRLVMVLLERGRLDLASDRCSDLEALAAKLGDGSELPFARTLSALTKVARGDDDGAAAIECALASLRAIDTKGHLAYALNFMANLDLGTGDLERAKLRAEEALRAAEAVGRRTEVARARTVLGHVAHRTGAVASASAELAALRDDIDRPLGLAATVRRAVLELAAKVDATGGAPAVASSPLAAPSARLSPRGKRPAQ